MCMIDRHTRELIRQTIHLFLGLAITFLYWQSLIAPIHLFYFLIVLGVLSFITKRFKIQPLWMLVEMLEREEDLEFPGRGPIFLVLGMLLAAKIFPRDMALAAMSVTAIGDSFSHLYGEVFGRTRYRRKNVEGTVAGILLSLPFAVYFAGPVGVAGAVAGMVAELVDLDMNGRPVNDNIAVPLAAGAAMLLLS